MFGVNCTLMMLLFPRKGQARLMLVMVLMMMVMMKFMVCHDALRQQTPEFPNALLNSARFWRTILGLKFPSSHSYRMIYSTSRWSYSNNIDHYSVITPLENKHVPSNTVVGRLLFIWNGPLVFMGVSPSLQKLQVHIQLISTCLDEIIKMCFQRWNGWIYLFLVPEGWLKEEILSYSFYRGWVENGCIWKVTTCNLEGPIFHWTMIIYRNKGSHCTIFMDWWNIQGILNAEILVLLHRFADGGKTRKRESREVKYVKGRFQEWTSMLRQSWELTLFE